ncbi:superoxide dismutase family protein [Streptomyces sp. NPDC086783]|uniref:superoxide dismutase family protein n=1 Tax=Streptomyces sp. NPDC086783 TaxID=3365758 RepID=UPI0038001F6A
MVAAICAGVLAATVLAAGGAPVQGGPGQSGPARVQGAPYGFWMRTDGRFAPAGAFASSAALSYDTDLVPAGARVEVGQRRDGRGATAVRLRVAGVRPGHTYGVHVHRNPCGADPADAGGHYQHREDPVQPSMDPHYANAGNEAWLDITADERGAGEALAEHDWGFRRGGASSVVVHDEPGMSGGRLACFTVPFGWVAGSG